MSQPLLNNLRADLDRSEEEGDVNALDDWCEKAYSGFQAEGIRVTSMGSQWAVVSVQ